jgi:hypothetical protein
VHFKNLYLVNEILISWMTILICEIEKMYVEKILICWIATLIYGIDKANIMIDNTNVLN